MRLSVDLPRQWLRLILVIVFIVLMLQFMTNIMHRRSGLRQIEMGRIVQFDQTLEVDYHLRYGALADAFNASRTERPIVPTTRRSLFERYRPAEDFFVLVDTRLEPVSLVYKGRIEQRDGSLIAQVNWGERTYFVRQGEAIGDWRIAQIDDERLVVRGSGGERLTLPYLEITYRKERIAVLYDYASEEELTVRAGSDVGPFSVTEISETGLTLSSGEKTITLTKE